jgi:hypothetical protein
MLDKESESGISDLKINVMFCAGPKSLVKFQDNKKDSVFYNIFCFHVYETGHYVVFIKIFKSLKKKNKDGNYFNLINTDSKVMASKEETYQFLDKFLSIIDEHDRFINEEILKEEKINATDAIHYIQEWEKSMLDYFNDLIPDVQKKSRLGLKKFLLF